MSPFVEENKDYPSRARLSERGYTLVLSMIALMLISAMSGIMVMSTQGEQRLSQVTRSDLQTRNLAEAGLAEAVQWFTDSYTRIRSSDLNTTAGTTVTDPVGKTFTTSVKLTGGQALVLNGTSNGTATTHPTGYYNFLGDEVSNLVTSFTNALSNKSISLGGSNGSGTYSVMATLRTLTPEVWRLDSVGSYLNKQKAVSIYLERLTIDPYIKAAWTAAGPVTVTGNHTIDGRDADAEDDSDDDDADTDIDNNDDDDDDDDFPDGFTGIPGIATTSNNPLPNVTGPGGVKSIVSGSIVEVTKTTIPPSTLPANYPVSNSLSPASYPYSPAGALGLTNGNYDSYLNSLALTSVPCTIPAGIVVINADFPTGPPPGGCSNSADNVVLIIHNPRYDPRYFDPLDPLYISVTSPIPGQTAEEYRADLANAPRTFNYDTAHTLKGIIIADAVGTFGNSPKTTRIDGAIISLSRLATTTGTAGATIKHHDRNIAAAKVHTGYKKKNGSFRQLTTQ